MAIKGNSNGQTLKEFINKIKTDSKRKKGHKQYIEQAKEKWKNDSWTELY